MSSPTGRPFGRYRLLASIAQGGMGEVFLATGPGIAGLEKRLAIKRLLPAFVDDEGFRARFLDEARLMVRLSHGNLVPVFEAGEVQGEYFLAMEWVDGIDLRHLARLLAERGESLPVPLALRIAHELARGLEYAHRATDAEGRPLGLIHRDVSPQNVLVGRDGQVRLTDFGIAKLAGKSRRTRTGGLVGKFAYMSPEQAAGMPLDARSDQFSLGVLLHELLTGRHLFDGESDPEVLRKVQAAEVVAPSTLRPEVGPELDGLVLQLLARAPDRRFADTGAACDALGRLLFSQQGGGAGTLAALIERIAPPPKQAIADALAAPLALPPLIGEAPRSRTRTVSPDASSPQDDEPIALPDGAVPGAVRWLPATAFLATALVGFGVWRATRPVEPLPTAVVAAVAAAIDAGSPAVLSAPLAFSLRPSRPPTISVPREALVPDHIDIEKPRPSAPPAVDAGPPPPDPGTPPRFLPEPGPTSTPPVDAGRPERRTTPVPVVQAESHAAPKPKALEPAPVVAAQGFLSVRVDPWAEIKVDGVRVTEGTVLLKHPLQPGLHQLDLDNPALGKSQHLEVRIASGETLVRRVDLRSN